MPDQDALPRCEQLDGSTLRIEPGNIEAGRFCEANCVRITDGERSAVYVPYDPPAPDAPEPPQ